jgi:hypothetical protein
MLMRTARIQVSGLICSIILACVLSSCGSQVKQADALVSESGTPVGMVVEYSSPIDKNTVDIESFQVPAWNIRSYFVSNSNPLKKIKGEKLSDGGRYVVYSWNRKLRQVSPTNWRLSPIMKFLRLRSG